MWLGLSNDTICAVSTARGVGGIAVIRLSGPRALEIARRCCPRLPLTVQSHRIYLCPFLEVQNGQLLDEVLASYFAHGRSFTGDETVEFSSHGGVVVPHLILQTLIEQGARLAQPGEFTFRAFRNGKLDLVQAEGVLQLIESQSTAAARLAIRQVKGHLSRKFLSLEEDLTWLLAQLEANINFSEDGLEFASQQSLNVRLTQLGDTVNGMIESFKTNHIVKEGLQVALVGAPNVGKSSLLNALVGEDSAIVTEHPGTTRDFVEGYVVSEGVLINFIDTAGLRETLDPVESIGIRRTLERIQTVDVVLWIRDACEQQLGSKPDVGGVRLVQVWNKCDMCQVLTVNKHQDPEFLVSAKTGLGIEDLRKYLVVFSQQCFQDFSEGVIQTRHKEILLRMQGRIKDGLCLMQKDSSPELLVFELQQCLQDVYQVLGKCFDDQVIDRVFKEFCLGK